MSDCISAADGSWARSDSNLQAWNKAHVNNLNLAACQGALRWFLLRRGSMFQMLQMAQPVLRDTVQWQGLRRSTPAVEGQHPRRAISTASRLQY